MYNARGKDEKKQ